MKAPTTEPEFLAQMDRNCVFAQIEHTRHPAGEEILERDHATLIWSSLGDAAHNLAMVSGEIDVDDLCETLEQFYEAPCAALYASHEVAGVGWVGTHPEHFRRGYGALATAAVVEK